MLLEINSPTELSYGYRPIIVVNRSQIHIMGRFHIVLPMLYVSIANFNSNPQLTPSG